LLVVAILVFIHVQLQLPVARAQTKTSYSLTSWRNNSMYIPMLKNCLVLTSMFVLSLKQKYICIGL